MKIYKLLCFLLLACSSFAQSPKSRLFNDPGIYLGGSWSKGSDVTLVPQAWFYTGDFYVEGRYNYEDDKTFSLHLGYPVQIDELKMEVIPTAGFVTGNFKGYVLGLLTDHSSRYLSAFTENEYCFSHRNTNFFFSWAGFTTPLTKSLSLGGSWQYTLEPFHSVFDVGPMVSWKKGLFQVELYAFNPWKTERYYQFGVSLDLGNKD